MKKVTSGLIGSVLMLSASAQAEVPTEVRCELFSFVRLVSQRKAPIERPYGLGSAYIEEKVGEEFAYKVEYHEGSQFNITLQDLRREILVSSHSDGYRSPAKDQPTVWLHYQGAMDRDSLLIACRAE